MAPPCERLRDTFTECSTKRLADLEGDQSNPNILMMRWTLGISSIGVWLISAQVSWRIGGKRGNLCKCVDLVTFIFSASG